MRDSLPVTGETVMTLAHSSSAQMTINELREDMELPAFEDERGDIIPAQTTPLPAPNTTPA